MQTNTILNIKSNSRKWKILDATNIKLIAVVLMFVDHIYQMGHMQGPRCGLTSLADPFSRCSCSLPLKVSTTRAVKRST